VAALLAGLAAAPPQQLAAALAQAPPSPDVAFQRGYAELQLGRVDEAAALVEAQATEDPSDWRGWWWSAVLHLAMERPPAALVGFERVLAEFPGELAPLLGFAVSAEMIGDNARAAWAYGLVSLTDPGSNAAHFGLARVRRLLGDRHGAADALARVPSTSTASTDARLLAAEVLSEPLNSAAPTLADLSAASRALEGVDTDPARLTASRRQVLGAALGALQAGAPPDPAVYVAGASFSEPGVRSALEEACRELARRANDPAARIELVDAANAVRRRTLL
jgi:serine/threonine-protein kinase PknG